MRLPRLALLVGLIAAVAPTQAHADTFYVDDSAGSPQTPCTSPVPANACTSINTAIVQARGGGFSGGDTILLAPGNYAEQVSMTSANDNGNVIDGAGTSPLPSLGTGIAPTNAADVGFLISSNNITLRDVHVKMNTAMARSGIQATGVDGHILNVVVDMGQAGNIGAGISVNTGPWTIDRATVGGNWAGFAVGTSQPPAANLTVRDSHLESVGNAGALGITNNSTALVQRSFLKSPPTQGGATVSQQGTFLTIDSSLILGGASGVLNSGAGSVTKIRGSTVDGGAPGTGGNNGLLVLGNGATGQITDSIVVEGQFAGADTSITCTSSNLPAQTQSAGAGVGSIACGPAGANTSLPLSALVVNPAGGDYHLRAGSPAIDSGSAGLAAAESATDLDGRARILDGNRDCAARRDKGAYELVAPFCIRPPTTAAADVTAPVLGKPSFAPRTFRVARGATPVSAKAKRGSRLKFTLSERSNVSIRIERATRGRRSRGKCRKATAKLRKGKRCTRWVRVRTLTRKGLPAGKNSVKFTGRIGKKALRRGRYRAVARATDAATNASKAARASFRIVR